MVDNNDNHFYSDNIDGLDPVYISALEIGTNNKVNIALEDSLSTLVNNQHFDDFILNKFDPNLLDYASEKYGLRETLNLEDISDTSKQIWDRNKMEMKKVYRGLHDYATIIQEGTDRLVEHISGLYETASNIKAGKPIQPQITINNNKKYNLNGHFAPLDLRPILNQTQNTFDFFDKVFIPYLSMVDKVISNLSLDEKWTDDSAVDFNKFYAKKWLKGSVPVEKDDRFRINSTLFRSDLIQGNKAIYFSGPGETKTDQITDWAFIVNTIRDFRIKFYSVPDTKDINQEDKVLDVSSITDIRQRLGILLGIAKRIQARKGYDRKIAAGLKRIERSSDTIRQKAGMIKEDESKKEAKPATSAVIHDVVIISNNVTRLIVDYNNLVAGMIRLTASLTLVADKELKAYQAPVKKPVQTEQHKE